MLNVQYPFYGCGHFIPCRCDDRVRENIDGTLFELITAISEKRYEFIHMKHITFFYGKRERQKFAYSENVMPMNESYHILSLRSLQKFTFKLPCL